MIYNDESADLQAHVGMVITPYLFLVLINDVGSIL